MAATHLSGRIVLHRVVGGQAARTLVGVHSLVRQAHDVLLAGGNPRAEVDGGADLGPPAAKLIQDPPGLGAVGATQEEQKFITADAEDDVVLAGRSVQRVGEGDCRSPPRAQDPRRSTHSRGLRKYAFGMRPPSAH